MGSLTILIDFIKKPVCHFLLLLALLLGQDVFGGENGEDNHDIDWFVFPFPIHSPETGWALTLSAIASGSIAEGPPSSMIAAASWSENDQKAVSLDTALNIGPRLRIGGRLAFEDWPTQYFGLGNDTDTDDEEFFDARNVELSLDVQREVAPRIWLGPRIVWRDHGVGRTAAGGLLEAGKPLGTEGGRAGGAGVIATYDTRDDLYAPGTGHYVAATYTVYGSLLGSDFGFRRFTLDARQFVSLGPDWILAFHQYLETTTGSVPFQELPQLGDVAPPARLRGHITGRFRDRSSAALQSELRFPLWGRLGAAAFAAVGDVAPSLGSLSLSELKWTGGAGLRFRALREQRINLRLDIGVGSDESGVYFSIMEAF